MPANAPDARLGAITSAAEAYEGASGRRILGSSVFCDGGSQRLKNACTSFMYSRGIPLRNADVLVGILPRADEDVSVPRLLYRAILPCRAAIGQQPKQCVRTGITRRPD